MDLWEMAFHFVDLLSHLNRERIPERVVHAKGAGAYGEFEVITKKLEPADTPYFRYLITD